MFLDIFYNIFIVFDFEKFPVYQLSNRFYSMVCSSIFIHKKLDISLKSQLRRASSSISLNIAEGAGKYSRKDKKNFYIIARGSANECVAILQLLKIEGIISESTYKELYIDLLTINKMLSGLVNKMMEK